MIKKVLITGADGFIGSHLTEALVRDGYDVRAFVFYNSFNSCGWLDQIDNDIKNSLDIFSGDIRDPFGVRQAIKNCDAVIHLAALIGIPYSYHSPATYVETNVMGTLNVLQAGRDLSVSKIIHTSTSEVYGTAQFVPITEAHPLQGQSPYSATKIAADQMALAFQRSFETPVNIIRPFNTYGPRQSARAIIPTIILQMLSGSGCIKLGATHPTRDFSFITDTVGGFLAMLKTENISGKVINLGSNFEIAIGDMARIIADLIGCTLDIEEDKKRKRPELSEVERLWADNSLAKELIGWQPAYANLSGFKKGITKTIDWFRNSENIASYKPGDYNV